MTTITPLPKPPTTQDSISFDVRADEFLESLPKFADELNAFGKDIASFGDYVETELEEEIKAKLEKAVQEGKNKIIETAKEKQKRLEAIAAIKSDKWQNIAQFILIMLKDIKANLEKERLERQRLLEYKLFFRESLPQGYKKPNSILKISDYPLVWFYCKNTAKSVQEGMGYTHFRLPQGNLYTKGVSEKGLVGSFGEQQLLEHAQNYSITNLANTGDRIKGGSDHHRNYSGHLSHSHVTTSNTGEKTNEVKRIHLLEGYYVGE